MGMDRLYFVYILASKKNGTLYIGITSNLKRRIHEHKQGLEDGFTKKHSVKQLVYFESHRDVRYAILREKRLKRWNRKWKIRLIESSNPNWEDLFDKL
jgi:putative endonuclease